ncbi:hypothetical protein NMY22_g19233 [Coprinellus aureogranulatus]|nr:hypothetical protein NMY22_g19233 [Coprinellus aureogranulatus]
MGGLLWRIATDDISIREALSGPPSSECLWGRRLVRSDGEGGYLVDEWLNADEIEALCGHYDLGIDGQMQRVSWWPTPEMWDRYYGTNGWTDQAEADFLTLREEMSIKFRPRSRSDWRKKLKTSSTVLRVWSNVESCSAKVVRKSEGFE